MFKATMDGTGIVVYSTEPGGEIILDMPELGRDDPERVAMTLEPSRILKGIFIERQNWSRMASSERPQYMAEHAPFDMLSIKFFAKEEETILLDYLLLKNPSLMLMSVEVEYKEIPGTSKPVGLEMLRWNSEWPISYEVPFFRAATGSLEWQRAFFDVNMAIDGGLNVCPFKTVFDAMRKSGNIDTYFYSDASVSLRNCVRHVELWDQQRYMRQGGAPWFIISGGIAAVRRISFNFAGAQFWSGFVSSAEFISLFSPPRQAPVVPIGTPELVVTFEGNAYNWYHPEELQFLGYPSYPPNIFSGTIPWESPFRLVKVVSGPNNTVVNRVVTKYRDDNTADWHFGSNLGEFYFLGNGDWRFSPVAMAWDIPIGETRQSSIDFLIEDEYGEHLCRAIATITGQAELVAPTILTLRPQYITVDWKKNDGVYNDTTACYSGSVFSNAHEAAGWTVTLIGWNASHVGTVRGMYGNGGGYAKIDANGTLRLWTNDALANLDQEEYPPGYVLHGYIEYSAQKGGQTRTAYINLYTTIIKQEIIPHFKESDSVIVKIVKNGSISGQIDFSEIAGASSVSVIGTLGWWPYEDYGEEWAFTREDMAAKVGVPGLPIYAMEFFGEYLELPGGTFVLNANGSWTFNTNGDFDYLQNDQAAGAYLDIYLKVNGSVELIFYLMIQIGDIANDYFGGP